MSKRKLLCLLLSLILLCSLAIPGTLAVSADAANDDAAPVEVNIVYPQPSTPDAQTTEPEEDCTPLGPSLYERIMACTTLEEIDAILDAATEQELAALTEEENREINALIESLEPEPAPAVIPEENDDAPVVSEIIYPTVNFDQVAPLGDPVVGSGD